MSYQNLFYLYRADARSNIEIKYIINIGFDTDTGATVTKNVNNKTSMLTGADTGDTTNTNNNKTTR